MAAMPFLGFQLRKLLNSIPNEESPDEILRDPEEILRRRTTFGTVEDIRRELKHLHPVRCKATYGVHMKDQLLRMAELLQNFSL